MKKMGERIARLGKNGGCRNMKKTIAIKKGNKGSRNRKRNDNVRCRKIW